VSQPLATLGLVADPARDPALAERAFVAEVVRGMASLRGGDAGPRRHIEDDLAIPLGLSAWIVRAAVDLPTAYDSLLTVRRAVVEASGLDTRTEPVPIRLPDPPAALRSLGAYLYDLVGRAARHAGLEPLQLAERTLTLLDGY
jgi:hypothetical protein